MAEKSEKGQETELEKFIKKLGPKARAKLLKEIEQVGSAGAVADRQSQARAILKDELPKTQIRIAPAVDFLNWDMEKRAQTRLPLNTHIGDFYHPSPIPGLITLEAIKIASQYGNPVAVVEDASPGQGMKLVYEKLAINPALLADHEKAMDSNLAHGTIDKDRALRDHFDRQHAQLAAEGIPVVFPDPRGSLFEAAQFTKEESRLLTDAKRTIRQTDLECGDQTREAFRKALTPEQRNILTSAVAKDNAITFGGVDSNESFLKLDRTIATNILDDVAKLKLSNPIIVSKYGGFHQSKKTDLNEHIPGTVLAVIPNSTAAKFPRHDALTNPLQNNDFPKAAFYYDEANPTNRLLIMDKDTLIAWHKDKLKTDLPDHEAEAKIRANKAYFLQLTPEQFTRWEQARDGDKDAQTEIKKLLDLSPEAKLACEPQVQAAIAPLIAGPMGAATWRFDDQSKPIEGSPSFQAGRGGGSRKDPHDDGIGTTGRRP